MRAIDADRLFNIISADKDDTFHHNLKRNRMIHIGEHNHFLKRIVEAPTLDVQPVVHAEWISHTPKDPSKNFHCSNCLGTVELPYYTYDCYYKYCPNCGAENGR